MTRRKEYVATLFVALRYPRCSGGSFSLDAKANHESRPSSLDARSSSTCPDSLRSFEVNVAKIRSFSGSLVEISSAQGQTLVNTRRRTRRQESGPADKVLDAKKVRDPSPGSPWIVLESLECAAPALLDEQNWSSSQSTT